MKHDLRVEQGHAVCFDKEICISEPEPRVKNNFTSNVFESEHISGTENDMKEEVERNFNSSMHTGTLFTNNNTYHGVKNNTKISGDSNYETMELVCSQEKKISTIVSRNTNDYRKLSPNESIIHRKDYEKEENVNIKKDEETEFEKFEPNYSDIQLKPESGGGNKCPTDKHSGDISEISGHLVNEMNPCSNASHDLSISENNRKDDQEDIILRNYNGSINTSSEKPTINVAREWQIKDVKNEKEHIYVDMNFSNKHLCVPDPSTDTPHLTTTALNVSNFYFAFFRQHGTI